MIRSFCLLLFITTLLLFSCKTEYDVRKGNTAPADPTIGIVVQKGFVNKAYISLLNRKPTVDEMATSLQLLAKDNVSQANREALIAQILQKPEYFTNLQTQARAQFLESVDEDKIFEYLGDFKLLLTNESQEVFFDIWKFHVDQLKGLLNLDEDLKSGKLSLQQMHQLVVNNWVYDQINMGSENFVISTFNHFLNRYPTEYELAQGKNLVEGRPGTLFLQTGSSKSDYLQAFFSSNNYLEGQVRYYYQKILLRAPSSEELQAGIASLRKDGDFLAFQKQLLASKEFAGL